MPGDFIDEHHQRIVEFATDFLDDEDEREGFIDGLMERRGYKRGWTSAPEQDEDPKGKGLLKPKAGTKPPAGKAAGYFRQAGSR